MNLYKTFFHYLDKPELVSNTKSPYEVYEGHTATLECVVRDANPITDVTYRWFKTENPSKVLHNKPTYIIHNIARERSGFCNCTANNSVGTSEAVTVNLDVQCKYWLIFTISNVFLCDDTGNQIENVKFITSMAHMAQCCGASQVNI